MVALLGPLGAGKTQLVKGLAVGSGVPDDELVVSPTFVLVREYAGHLRLYHIDAYRLTGAEELTALGFDELRERPDAAIVIEWADRVLDAIPPEACWVELQHISPRRRHLHIRWSSGRVAELAKYLTSLSEPGLWRPEAVDRRDDSPETNRRLE